MDYPTTIEKLKDDYEIKRAWNTFSFEFQKLIEKLRSETEILFIKTTKAEQMSESKPELNIDDLIIALKLYKNVEEKLKEIHEIADITLKAQVSLEPSLVKVARKRYDALLKIRGLSYHE